MKSSIGLTIIGLLGWISLAFAQQHQPGPFSLLLRAVQMTVGVGSPISVELTTTNTSNRPIKFSKTSPGMEYQIRVQDAQGKLVDQTPLYKELQSPTFVFRASNQTLEPQKSITETFNVADFFQLNKPNTYSVQVQRWLPRQLGTDVVKSNTVVVRVTP